MKRHWAPGAFYRPRKGAAKMVKIFTVLEVKTDHFWRNGAAEKGPKNTEDDFFGLGFFLYLAMKP